MKQVEGTLLYMNMIYLKGNWLQIQENLSYGKKYKTKDEASRARHHENLTPIYTSGAGNTLLIPRAVIINNNINNSNKKK